MTPYFCGFIICYLFVELDEVLGKLGQGPSMPQQQQPRVTDTTDTSGENTDVEQPRRRVRSRRTFKLKKGYAVGELAQFFVTGPKDAANKLSEFLLKSVSEGCAGSYAWGVRDHPALSRTPPFFSRSTASP